MTVGADCERVPRYVHGKSTFFSRNTIQMKSFSIKRTFVASKNEFLN